MGTDVCCTGAWIETYTGKKFHLLNPHPDEIDILDIAHALSNQCRYTGHTRKFLSVAEHCWHVSQIAARYGQGLAGLLHDASEAYLCDLSRPVKQLTPVGAPYYEIENRIMQIIAEKFGFSWPMSAAVKGADNALLLYEKDKLMTSLSWDDDASSEEARKAVREFYSNELPCWAPEEARSQFLSRFNFLTSIPPSAAPTHP